MRLRKERKFTSLIKSLKLNKIHRDLSPTTSTGLVGHSVEQDHLETIPGHSTQQLGPRSLTGMARNAEESHTDTHTSDGILPSPSLY